MVRALFSVRLLTVMCAASLWLVDLGQAEAALMKYTLDSKGTISGTLGGTAFTDKTFSITQTGDTSNIVSETFNLGAISLLAYSLPGTASITIEGVGTATFTSTTDMRVLSENVTHSILGHLFSGVGFVDYSPVSGGGLPSGGAGVSTGTTFYDLSTPFNASGDTVLNTQTYLTSSGDLVITSNSVGATTVTASAVPEPSSLALGAVGAGLALLIARRRRS
jgi:hypothetical protein